MASKKCPRGTPEFEMFGAFFKIYQEFYEVEETDEYWDGFIEKADVFVKEFGQVKFGRKMMSAFADCQEEELDERRKNNDS